MDEEARGPDPFSRRTLLRGAAAAGIGAFLTACGSSPPTSPTPSSSRSPSAPASASPSASRSPGGASPSPSRSPRATASEAPPGGTLRIANWRAYIDLTGDAGEAGRYAPGSSPTIQAFQEATGVTVEYVEQITDNRTFFESLRPQLESGQPTGWDLIVNTDWLAAEMVRKGWLERIDPAHVPNCVRNLRRELRGRSWDPGQEFHYPWQAGMTGLAYNRAALERANLAAPTRVADLWTLPPDRVSFLREPRDTFGLTMLSLGREPARATAADLQRAHDEIEPLVSGGLRFLGSDRYPEEFANGSLWAAMAWSGDIASAGGREDVFVIPTEGGMAWADNMLIPKGAANKRAAEAFMDFVYDPEVAARIAGYVYFVSPVDGAQGAMRRSDAAAADNELIFPGPDVFARLHSFRPLGEDESGRLNALFRDLAGD